MPALAGALALGGRGAYAVRALRITCARSSRCSPSHRSSSSSVFLFASPVSEFVLRARARAARSRGPTRRRRWSSGLRRDLDDVAPRRGTAGRRRALPELRRARPRLDVVPERRHRGRLDGQRRACDPHRALLRARPSPRLLGASGQSLHTPRRQPPPRVAESLTQLCPHALCPEVVRRPFPRRMESLLSDVAVLYPHLVLPPRPPQAVSPPSPTRGARFSRARASEPAGGSTSFEDFLSSLDGGHRPLLAFAHVMLPHLPWEFLPSGRRYAGGDLPGFETGGWSDDEFLVQQGYQRYLLQLGFADRLLGDLVRAPARRRTLRSCASSSLLADHGVSFRPGERRRALHGIRISTTSCSCRCFVKTAGPGGRAASSTSRVQTVDILPTIADVLGVEVPWRVDANVALRGARG